MRALMREPEFSARTSAVAMKGNRGAPRCSMVLPSEDLPDILYRDLRGGAQGQRCCSPALRLTEFPHKFSDEYGEFQVPFARLSSRNGCERCPQRECVEAAVFQKRS